MKEQYSSIITSHKPILFPWYHVMLEVGGFSAIAITILFPTILEVSLRPFPTPVFDCLQFVVNDVCVEGGRGCNLVAWFPREAGVALVVHNHTGGLCTQTIYGDIVQLDIHCAIIARALHNTSENTLHRQ